MKTFDTKDKLLGLLGWLGECVFFLLWAIFSNASN